MGKGSLSCIYYGVRGECMDGPGDLGGRFLWVISEVRLGRLGFMLAYDLQEGKERENTMLCDLSYDGLNWIELSFLMSLCIVNRLWLCLIKCWREWCGGQLENVRVGS